MLYHMLINNLFFYYYFFKYESFTACVSWAWCSATILFLSHLGWAPITMLVWIWKHHHGQCLDKNHPCWTLTSFDLRPQWFKGVNLGDWMLSSGSILACFFLVFWARGEGGLVAYGIGLMTRFSTAKRAHVQLALTTSCLSQWCVFIGPVKLQSHYLLIFIFGISYYKVHNIMPKQNIYYYTTKWKN